MKSNGKSCRKRINEKRYAVGSIVLSHDIDVCTIGGFKYQVSENIFRSDLKEWREM